MCSINISVKIGLAEVYFWILTVSYSAAAPIINCGSGWTYGRHLSGLGCLRPLTRTFDLKACLLNGHHITLISVPWDNIKRKDMYCIKDESLPYETQNRQIDPPPNEVKGDLKIDINAVIDDAIEGQPKALGCCLDGIQPTG